MTDLGSLLSPVIVGRDDHIALVKRRLGEVLAGNGQLLLVSGEAGIGKTRLVSAIAHLAAERGFRVAKGEVAPQDRDVLAASFLDLGRSMRRDPAFGTLGRDLLEVIGSRLKATMPRRRDLVMEIVDLLGTGEKPTVLIFEDLQWADDLSLEALAELARQTRESKLLVVGAYRANEAALTSVLREWRARLVTQRLAEELRLGRLSRDETAQMTTEILATGLPAPRDVVDAVYARTDGVPLHIEELCSALGRERLGDSRAVMDVAVPATLEDATLARIGRLSPAAQAAARAAAVLGRSFVPAVLAGILNLPVNSLDNAIQELVDHDVLDRVGVTDQYDFRHQLLRDALYRSVPAGDRRRFHARAAEFGGQLEGATQTHASLHFERAGMTAEAFTTALSAAEQAMRMSSHREAFELARRAIDNMPASLPDDERLRVLLLYSEAAGNVDKTELSIDVAKRAREMALRIGNKAGALEGLANLVGIARRDGAGIAHNRGLARQMLNEAEALPPGNERNAYLVLALYVLSLIEMDACRFPESRALLDEAIALQGSHPVAMPGHLAIALAKFDIVEGRVDEGLARIQSIGEATRARGEEDSGIGSYRDFAVFAMRALDFRRAGVGIDEALRYAESVEQTYCGHVLASCQSVLSWAENRWDDALRQGGQALSDPGCGWSRDIAQWGIGYVHAGRGHGREAEEYLLPALEYGRRSERLDLLLPALWGLAEAKLHSGDPAGSAALSEEALALAREQGEWMHIAPFAVTGVRAHQAAGKPEAAARYLEQFLWMIGPGAEIARPATLHATGLVRLAEGSVVAAKVALESAVAMWEERGRGWEALWARLDLASALLRSSRFVDAMTRIGEVRDVAQRIGSEPLLARADQLERVARGRGAEQEPWHPLTTREFEVARKIAEGLTNAEVAGELGISPKTASAHLEHIFAKLGVSRRAEVASWATAIASQPSSPRQPAAPVR
jgi:DNA-binding CsgD family transcriptional regulator